jgi:hypothetical protein
LLGSCREKFCTWLRLTDCDVSLADQIPPGVGRALSAPIIGHGGNLVACSGKNLLAFNRNGSFAWIVPLGYNCRQDIRLVTERDKVMI